MRELAVVISLLFVFVFLGLRFAFTTSPAFDEPFFLHAGYTNLTAGAPKVPTANLILAQNWMALPLLSLPLKIPTAEDLKKLPAIEQEPGRLFLFHPENDWRTIIHRARIMNLVAGMALALTIYFWSRSVFGATGAAVSLAFYCLSPVMISNSSLATTDIMTALWFALALNRWWVLLHRISIPNIITCGVATGLLFVTKISSVVLVPMVVCLIVARMASRRPVSVILRGFPARAIVRIGEQVRWLSGTLIASALIGIAVMWLCYLPQLTIFASDGSPLVAWESLTSKSHGILSTVANLLGRWHVLPLPYLQDLHLFDATTALRRGYLLGEYSLRGWVFFFPAAWWFKTPIPFILALALAAGALCRVELALAFTRQNYVAEARESEGLDRYQLAPLVVLIGVYIAFSITSGLNIGIRHLLPIYPPVFIFAGAIMLTPWPARVGRMVVTALLLWSVREVWHVAPQFLAYFNQFAGGPENGHEVLVDSSYEWGQDLPAVEKWLAERAAKPGTKTPVYFSYFGNADLGRFKINATMLPGFFDLRSSADYGLQPGTYIISATMLHSLYGPLCGPWRTSYESLYQSLLPEIRALGSPSATPTLTANERNQRVRLLDALRFGRLCGYLRQRVPDARITYGMFVFELTEAEIAKALWGVPQELRINYEIPGSEKLPQTSLDFQK